MLQIIGWVLCAALFVKGLEIIANPAYRSAETNKLHGAAKAGAAFAIIAAVLFSFAVDIQGRAIDRAAQAASPYGLNVPL